jgi:hypothetical protein
MTVSVTLTRDQWELAAGTRLSALCPDFRSGELEDRESGVTTERWSSTEIAQRRQTGKNYWAEETSISDNLLAPSVGAPNEPNAIPQSHPPSRLATNRRRAPVGPRATGSRGQRPSDAPSDNLAVGVNLLSPIAPAPNEAKLRHKPWCFNGLRRPVAAHRTSRMVWPGPRGATDSFPLNIFPLYPILSVPPLWNSVSPW